MTQIGTTASAGTVQLAADKAAKILHIGAKALRAWAKENLVVSTYQRDGNVVVEIARKEQAAAGTTGEPIVRPALNLRTDILNYPPGLSRWR